MPRPVIFLLPFLIFACGKNTPGTHFDQKQTEAEIRQMMGDYHAATKAGGLTAEFPYLDQSDDFFWVPPGFATSLDFPTVKGIIEKNAGLFRSVDLHWDTLQVFPLSSEIATYTGIVGGEMVDTSGQKTTVSIIESGTLIRRADGWKLLCGQSRNL